ncbi:MULTISPECIES: hypothetical protein [Neobacillus]|uniref:Nucleoporin-interacting protein n=1 Tax=Neobacillus rhizophilus TaxID=2833579 RepID=A0A942U3P1_9BACI|nr:MULTISPECIES: hypothetical protein [Neobacillus]MBS4212272.1 hypothetical protein [Neobacillus rhizophilus]MBU8915707.1 hypothetical protein [Bacillus sp. FJAT-29953]
MKLAGFNRGLLIAISMVTIIIVIASQLYFLNPFASTWDQVDFSLAVNRFDLMAMQPHFPGYPFFILGGKILYPFLGNPAEALTMFNILAYASSLFPIYRLFRKFLPNHFSWLATAIIFSQSYIVIMVNQPMSEGTALAVFWWFVWSLSLAMERHNSSLILLPLGILSIMLGTRLSYLPFALGILLLFFWKWKNGLLTVKEAGYYALFGLVFQACWVVALIISEGSLTGFIKLSLAFTSGHFTDWGGAVETSEISFLKRSSIFLWDNILWTGIAAKEYIIAVIYLCLFIMLGVSKGTQIGHEARKPLVNLIYLLFFSYFLWALLAQNIEKPRHILPLAVLLIFYLCFQLFANRIPWFITVLAVILLGFQTVKSVELLKTEAAELPAVYQMNAYIEKMNEPVILYTWEETRVLQYLHAPYTHKRINTYQLFQMETKYYQGRTVLLTDKVVKGFVSQGGSVKGKIKKLKSFKSRELYDPVYNEITLYKWIDH